MSDNIEREIGKLQGRMEAWDKRLEDIEGHMDERLTKIEGYLQEIRDAASMGKGAWWLLLKIGAVLTAIIGALTWVIDKAMGKLP
jgi:hypothetical protein